MKLTWQAYKWRHLGYAWGIFLCRSSCLTKHPICLRTGRRCVAPSSAVYRLALVDLWCCVTDDGWSYVIFGTVILTSRRSSYIAARTIIKSFRAAPPPRRCAGSTTVKWETDYGTVILTSRRMHAPLHVGGKVIIQVMQWIERACGLLAFGVIQYCWCPATFQVF